MGIQFKQTLKTFSVLLGVLLFGILLGVSLSNTWNEGNQASLGMREDREAQISVDLTIDYGNGDIQTFPQEVLPRRATILDLLESLERKGIAIEKRNFPGLGVFIEAIHGVHNTNNSYWQYWVNGEYAKVGTGQYELRHGDEVLWKRTSEVPYRPR